MPVALQHGDYVVGADGAGVDRGHDPRDVLPGPADLPGVDPAAGERVERPVVGRLADAPASLVGQVGERGPVEMPSSSRSPNTTSEYEPASVTTISGGDPPSRPKMTSIMCRESRTVPDTNFGAPPHAAVVHGVEPGHAPLRSEVLLVGPGERGGHGDDEPHSVDRGDHAAAPRLREGKARLAGDQRDVRRREGLGADVVLEDVRQPRPLQRRRPFLRDRPVADVHGVRGQARGDRDRQVVQPGPAARHRGERARELRRPGHDLQEHLRQVDARQHRRGPGAQVHQRRRLLDGLEAGEVDLPVVVDGDLGVDGQAAADLAVGGIQRPGVLREQGGGVTGQAECRQDVVAGRVPRRAFQEAALRVAPPGGGLGPDVAALEAAPELLEHAAGVGVPAHRAVLVRGVAEHQVPPRAADHARVDQPAGDERGRQAAAVGQDVGQGPHGREHRRALGAGAELDHGREHLQEPGHRRG